MKDTKGITYVKIAFRSRKGITAGLVVPYEEMKWKSLSELSRFFPYSEVPYMKDFLVSPQFPTWERAFDFSFSAEGGK